MALFRRNQSIDTGPPLVEGLGAPKHVFTGQVALQDTLQIYDVIDDAKLQKIANGYTQGWEDVDTIVENMQFKGVLSEHGEGGTFELEDGSGRTMRKRKLTHEDEDAMLLAVISARVTSWDSDVEHVPYVFSFINSSFDTDYKDDRTSLKIFEAIKHKAETLQGIFRKIESSVNAVVIPFEEYIAKGSIDELVSWVRQSATQEDMKHVMEVIAQDVHDQKRGRLARTINERIAKDEGRELKEKFADALEHQDGEFAPEVEILNFAIIALSQRQITADIAGMITTIEYRQWPQALKKVFVDYKQDRIKDVLSELSSLTLPFYQKNRRKPSAEDLKKLEDSCITTPEQMQEESRIGRPIKRSRAKVSQDFITPETRETEPPKQAIIDILKIDPTSKNREVAVVPGDEEAHVAALVDRYCDNYKLDASRRLIAKSDIVKMITALKTNATRNYGVTKLSEVRPLKDEKGQQHSVWRLNPAHYNGLSVSRAGKDTRVIYTISANGHVGIVGIYTHDDYDQAVKNLR